MGQQDILLNEVGIRQAQKVAYYLKDSQITIDRIISSPLMRARQTAEIISNTINTPINFHTGFKEVYFGTAEGKLKAYENLHESWVRGITPEAAESWVTFKHSVIEAIIQSLQNNCTADCGAWRCLLSDYRFFRLYESKF
jgi:broad specificity phosphatase PhoE